MTEYKKIPEKMYAAVAADGSGSFYVGTLDEIPEKMKFRNECFLNFIFYPLQEPVRVSLGETEVRVAG